MSDVEHPDHYGGDLPTEPVKVIRAWDLGFALGNVVKYLSRAGKKGDRLTDLKKALFYLEDEIAAEEKLASERAAFDSSYVRDALKAHARDVSS